MRNLRAHILLMGWICVCLAGQAWCGAASQVRESVGDFVLHRDIPVNLVAGTPEHPRLIEVTWVRIEPLYGNAWVPTAHVGWSSAAEASWRIKIELLDDQGRVLPHSRDEPTAFTGRAGPSDQRGMHYADLALDAMQFEGRRHAAKVRVRLEPAKDDRAAVAPEASASHTLAIAVRDGKSREPVAGATVVAKALYRGERHHYQTVLHAADARGECRLVLAKAGLVALTAIARKDGYAAAYKGWSNPSPSPIAHVPLTDLPERYEMGVVPAQSLGGLVQDEQDRPVAGVQVKIEEAGGGFYGSRIVQTDEEGHWRVTGMSSEMDAVSLRFKHNEYMEAQGRVSGDELAALRTYKHVTRLSKGLTVSGRVLDEQGRPMPRAAVILAPAYSGGFHYEYAYTLTDRSGQFRFGCARSNLTDTGPGEGSTGVLVEVPGYTAALQSVVVEPNLAPLEFRLARGGSLTVRVVSPDQRPLAGAWTVMYPLTEDPRYGRWQEDTDEQGRFRIVDAPDHEMLLTVGRNGYITVRDQPLPASGKEHVVTMTPAPRVQGTVRDAETGKSIPYFEVAVASAGARGTRTREPIPFREGRFELTFDEAMSETLEVKILAAGYQPATSESISLAGTRVLEFKLAQDPSFDAKALQRERGDPRPTAPDEIRGIVLDPNGRPAANVAISVHPLPVPEAVSDAEGRFKLRGPPSARMGVSVERDTPYVIARDRQRNLAAAVELDQAVAGDLIVKLSPGVVLSGRVTGVDGKAIPGTKIHLTFWAGQMGYGLREETGLPDSNGYYEIRAVPPDYRYLVNAGAEGYGRDYLEVRTVEAVNNRMELEPMILKVANLDVSGMVVDTEDKPVPGANVYCYGRGQTGQQVRTDAQGRFAIRGVCAGRAQIQANTMDTTRLYGRVETEGGATGVKIVISPMASAGRFIPAKPPSLVGKPLPSLSDLGIEQTADSYKDRMILLCFFDMNQRPSRRCLTTLAQQAADLKQKGVTVIAVQAAQADAAALAQWVKEQGITLPVGAMRGDVKKASSAWGVASLPWLILTDKSHVVRGQGFALGELNAKIEEAGSTK